MAVRDLPIAWPEEAIAAFCRRNHIRKLSLFGSVLRDDFTPESDIDVLVEFEEGYRAGLAFFGMGAELQEILGREVDLGTPAMLHPGWAREVMDEARVVYVVA